ncbi:glycosyltransferase family 2 protein [Candidatus Gottesmanbacteria bacterium]|nr:glycosyltransferase family 2 protein [Candidatus Gottesmanbacteria bacterium]
MKKPKVIVVMPAFNAEKTLEKTYQDLPRDLISEVIVVDDKSKDKTVEIARKLGLKVFVHFQNLGYGGNQKTCYWEALKRKPDVVVMLHPDYQYDSTKTEDLVKPILNEDYDLMFGSRIRTRDEALKGGMPLTKYILNRIFCVIENMVLGVNFSEHFSGFRAYSRKVLETVPFQRFSNDFVFDQQMMMAAIAHGFRVGEIPVPVRYFSEASSIKFLKGSKFLLETALSLLRFLMEKIFLWERMFF